MEEQAAIGNAATGILHDLTTPLTSLASHLSFLRMSLDSLSHEEVQEALDLTVQRLKQVRQLVGSVGGFAGSCRPRFDVVDVHELLRQSIGLVSDEADRRSIRISMFFDPSIIRCDLDPPLMRRTLINLLRNAIEAMPEGGPLDVSTRHRDAFAGRPAIVLIRIADSGVGITPDDLRRLFRPLFSTKAGAAGLGLTFCRQTVEDHGGQLRITSAGANQGTVATVSLPVRSLRPEKAAATFDA